MSKETPGGRTSRLSGFYQKSVAERTAIVARWADLTPEEVAVLHEGLTVAQADKMIENVIGRYSLPLGVGTNFLINGKEYLVPMVVEEPSVVAAVSYAAKLARAGEGFQTGSTDPIMIAQIQLLDVPDADAAAAAIARAKAELLAGANTSPSIAQRGGGPVDIETRHLPQTPAGPMLVVHLLFDVRDAMGANAVNTAAEAIAPILERLTGGRALLRILSNLTDRRRAWAEVTIPAKAFGVLDFPGEQAIEGIAQANAFAVADPYRAATHNKGILNGIDAVALATGNDWRAIEAGAPADSPRHGQ
jgi:hydroxymethylglutaryl-CoA reductase